MKLKEKYPNCRCPNLVKKIPTKIALETINDIVIHPINFLGEKFHAKFFITLNITVQYFLCLIFCYTDLLNKIYLEILSFCCPCPFEILHAFC